MSWIEQLNNVSVLIRTGDGATYSPLWKDAKRTKAYNTAAYNFIGVAGTLIDRKLPEGYQYDIDIIFQGENHIDVSKAFQVSSDDPRFWTISHPYWGDIKVQPVSIEEDKSTLNITLFRVRVWETIASVYPVQKQLSNDRVVELRNEVNNAALESFAAQIPVIDTALKTTMVSAVVAIDNTSSSEISDSNNFAEFKKKVATAKRFINDSTNSSIDVLRSAINVINYPVDVVTSVTDRINISKELTKKLASILLANRSKNNTILYESMCSGIVANIAVSGITPSESDYKIRSEVISAVDSLRIEYEIYLQNLDELQALRSDQIDTFTPNSDVNRYLEDAVMDALSNIYDYGFGAKQERVVYLEENSNPISLAHRFYGLDLEDENLLFFINTNSLKLDELIQVKKGRKLVYYV